eukprot:11226684-Lingulodinium_polyedra.AAC.1
MRFVQDDLAFAKVVVVPARSWVARVTQGMPMVLAIGDIDYESNVLPRRSPRGLRTPVFQQTYVGLC